MREALQGALADGGDSLLHESFHLVILLRRALGELNEKERLLRDVRARADEAERSAAAAEEKAAR